MSHIILRGSHRCVLLITFGSPDATAGKIGNERWFAFSLFVPADWQDDRPSSMETVFQVHHSQDACDTKNPSPPFAIMIVGGNFVLGRRSDPNPCSNNTANAVYTEKRLGSVTRGVWNDFVVHVRWGFDGNAFTQVWRNDILQIEDHLPNFYNDVNEGYAKFGIYKWGWKQSPDDSVVTNARVVYYDQIRIGDSASNYDEVMPSRDLHALPMSLEGELMPLHSSGYAYQDSWKLNGNGYVGEDVSFPEAGDYLLRIRAAGLLVAGGWSKMMLQLDGKNLVTYDVDSATRKYFETIVTAAPGIHRLRFYFTNDYADSTGDRNLFLDRVQVKKSRTLRGIGPFFGESVLFYKLPLGIEVLRYSTMFYFELCRYQARLYRRGISKLHYGWINLRYIWCRRRIAGGADRRAL